MASLKKESDCQGWAQEPSFRLFKKPFKEISKDFPEKSELLKNLDDEIIDLIDNEDVDRINSEVYSSFKQTEDITKVLIKNEKFSENLLFPSHSDILSIGSHKSVSTNNINYNVKVSKLAINKLDRNALNFVNFWDQFKAAIHLKLKLNSIDKFNHLISYLKDKHLDTIRGLSLSSENYA